MPAITDLAPRRDLDDPAAEAWFWRIVDASVTDDETAQRGRLQAELDHLSDQDLVDFVGLYGAVHRSLYSHRLWAAAYLVNGGCSDDGFIDFRAWLMSRGRAVTERAVADADSLADLGVEMDCASFEAFGYVMLDVFRARADGAFPRFPEPASQMGGDAPLKARLPEPAEPDWAFDFDDHAEMRRRLPRLAAMYL